MKTGIHPELMKTKVHCNGCGTDFETIDTVENITVDICSNCHPFYTGKQKLVDTAGRVETFKRRTELAKKKQADEAKRAATKAETVEAPADTAAETPEAAETSDSN